jgi:amino acid adenylation domain-containing protein
MMSTAARHVLNAITSQAARAPHAIAVGDPHDQWTYARLWCAAGHTAAMIRNANLDAGQPILLGLRPSTRWLAALLGIWWAGGIAVPVDLDQPPSRLSTLAASCRAALVLTACGDTVPWAPALPAAAVQDGSVLDLRLPEQRPGRAACVFFTSGSSGDPKPVLLGHTGLADRVHAMADRYDIGQTDRVAQLTAPAFDPILWELLPVLVRGGQVHIPTGPNRLPGPGLASWLAEAQITAFTCTPTVLAALPFTDLPTLRLIVLGGEALHAGPLEAWLARYRVANAYGPTEITTEALVAAQVRPGEHPVPIGLPYPGVNVQILDADQRPVPDGQVGELYLSGTGLALEYLGRPAETAAAFPVLNSGDGPRRYFRTGDLVRRLPDGQLTFIGRTDRQLNLGGVRLEPGEIEACALQLTGVRAAAATTTTGADDRPVLALYVVAEHPVTGPMLRRHLASHLPASAVPAHIQFVDQFPRTPSGKIDYASLARTHASAPPAAALGRLAELPEQVLVWWQELAEIPATPGVEFFTAGATSIAALRLIAQINQEYGTEVTITEFLADPTIDHLAHILAAAAPTGGVR